MKIRMGIALLTMTLLLCQTSFSFSGRRVASYQRTTESRTYNVCMVPPGTNTALRQTYSWSQTFYDPWDNGTTESYWGWSDCTLNTVHRDEQWWQTTWPCCEDLDEEGWQQGWRWSGGQYSEFSNPVPAYNPTFALGKCIITTVTPRSSEGFQWEDTMTDRYETRMELLTGGTTGSSLWVFTIGATDGRTGQPIPPEQVTLFGKAASPSGDVYKLLPDNTRVDATPATLSDCYTYTISPGLSSKLGIYRGSENITGKTNVYWVGERVGLECLIGVGNPTNYSWTVPGEKFADYVINPTNAYLVGLTNLSQESVNFFWTAGGTFTVNCTAIVGGETMTASATFIVHKPEAQLWFRKRGFVEVTTQVVDAGGAYWLTTGKDYTRDLEDPNQITDVGMLMEYRIDDLKGFTNAYTVSYAQVITFDMAENLADQDAHRWAKGRVLDARFPYKRWNAYQQSGHTTDTPRSPLGPLTGRLFDFHWRKDDFTGLLMWQADRGIPSVPAPLKVGAWNWYGRARLTSTNTPAWTYAGVPPYIEPTNYTGVNWNIPLTWTNLLRVDEDVEWNFKMGRLPTP